MREETFLGGNPSSPAAEAFQRQSVRKKRLILGLTALTFLLAAVAINAGAADTHPMQVLRTLLGLKSGASSVVIWNIRLPRVIAGIVAGIGLAVAGCVMQTCLRNPLASPFTLGISNAAAFGANLAIVFFGAGTLHSNTHDAVFIGNPYTVTISAFAFSMAAMIARDRWVGCVSARSPSAWRAPCQSWSAIASSAASIRLSGASRLVDSRSSKRWRRSDGLSSGTSAA